MPRFYPTVEIALGANATASPSTWSWTDLTMQGFVHNPSGITITRGRGDRYSQASADTCSLTLINNNGRFVPSNPLSPYYGQLKPGTPIRVLMRPNTNSASDAFNRTTSSSWGSADVGGAWTVVGTAADYSVSPTNGGRHTHPVVATAHHSTLAFSLLRSDITVRVRVNATSTGAAQTVGIMSRYIDASNFWRMDLQFGTSGTITARVVYRTSGTDNVAYTTTVPFTHSTSTWYRMRFQTALNSGRFKIWLDGTTEPATWLIDGTNGFFQAGVAAGKIGLYSIRETSNTNSNATIDFDDFVLTDGPRVQFTGFADGWPLRWADASLNQAFAPITASGQLQRVGHARALRSAIYRASTINLAVGTPTVVAYWPMEDGSTAKSFASAVGGPATVFTGDVRPASDSSVLGSEPLPIFGGTGSVRHKVPGYAATGTWAVRWAMKIPASSISGSAQIMSWMTPTGSPIVRWQMTLNSGSPDTVSLSGWNAANTVVFAGTTVNFVDPTSGAELSNGRQLYFEVTGTQNGGNVDTNWNVWFVPDAGGSAQGIGATQSTASTNANVTLIYHDAATGFANGGHTIGHVGVGNDAGFGASATGVTGGAGDRTDTRFIDLCNELGVTSFLGDLVRGQGTATQQMGPQGTGDALQELQLVESTEAGTLYDGKQAFIHLLPREMRYNRPVDMTLDIHQQDVGWPFEPTLDDYLLRNDITVSNVGGSSARSIDDTSISQSGVHTDSASTNTYLDSDLQLQADWRLNMGLADGIRIPTIVLNLTKNYVRLADAWCDTDIGSRIQVTNIPSGELPPETLDLVVDGYTETITSSTWTASLNVSPSGQWLAGVLDTNRLDCSASTTATALSSGATSMPVAWADACNWTHADGNYDVFVGGERMTVTAVADVLDDGFTRTVSNGWGSADTGQAWTNNGGSASDYSVASGQGKHSLGTVGTERLSTVDIGSKDTSFFVDVQFGVTTALTSAIRLRIAARAADTSNFYMAQLELGTDSIVRLSAQKRVAGSNSSLTSGGTSVVVDTNTSPTDTYRVTLTVIGSTITATATRAGGATASTSGTDTTITTGTLIVLGGVLLAGNTNTLPVVLGWDHLTVGNPQTLTVTRSVNGIVKTHAVGEEVHVASPIILAL